MRKTMKRRIRRILRRIGPRPSEPKYNLRYFSIADCHREITRHLRNGIFFCVLAVGAIIVASMIPWDFAWIVWVGAMFVVLLCVRALWPIPGGLMPVMATLRRKKKARRLRR